MFGKPGIRNHDFLEQTFYTNAEIKNRPFCMLFNANGIMAPSTEADN